jgi:4-methylaminobutanoate oxidase (formaldehyde-forming)
MQWLCSNNVDVAVGGVVYTLLLNHRAGIECELTVIRLAQDQYLLTTASLTRVRDTDWVRRHTTQFDIEVIDRTDDYSVLGVMGPNAQGLLEGLCNESFGLTDFPFATSRQVDLGGSPVRASRLSFVGESGWEILIDNDHAVAVLDQVIEAGKARDIGMAGIMTMECCRLEKGYLHWGHEIGPEENPYHAGLGFAVKKSKPGGFLGLEALEKLDPVQDRSLVLFRATDTRPLLLHDEPIYLGGRWIGRTTSGGIGFRVGQALCFGYIDTDCVPGAGQWEREFEVKVAGQMHSLVALAVPPYDPQGQRMRGKKGRSAENPH